MTLDLEALKAYEHHLNETASDEHIVKFRRLSLEAQCAVAVDWQSDRHTRRDIAERDTYA